MQDLLEYYHMGCGGSKHMSVTVSASGLALIEASTIKMTHIPALDEIFQHAAQIMSTIEDINAGLISVVMAIRQARAPPLAAVTLAAVLSPPRLALALSHHALVPHPHLTFVSQAVAAAVIAAKEQGMAIADFVKDLSAAFTVDVDLFFSWREGQGTFFIRIDYTRFDRFGDVVEAALRALREAMQRLETAMRSGISSIEGDVNELVSKASSLGREGMLKAVSEAGLSVADAFVASVNVLANLKIIAHISADLKTVGSNAHILTGEVNDLVDKEAALRVAVAEARAEALDSLDGLSAFANQGAKSATLLLPLVSAKEIEHARASAAAGA